MRFDGNPFTPMRGGGKRERERERERRISYFCWPFSSDFIAMKGVIVNNLIQMIACRVRGTMGQPFGVWEVGCAVC